MTPTQQARRNAGSAAYEARRQEATDEGGVKVRREDAPAFSWKAAGTENKTGELPPSEWAKQFAAKQFAKEFAKKIVEEDPESAEAVQKLEAAASSERVIHNKEAKGLFAFVKKRFGKGFVDDDMKRYDRAFGLLYWLGKKYASMNRAFDTLRGINLHVNSHYARSGKAVTPPNAPHS